MFGHNLPSGINKVLLNWTDETQAAPWTFLWWNCLNINLPTDAKLHEEEEVQAEERHEEVEVQGEERHEEEEVVPFTLMIFY